MALPISLPQHGSRLLLRDLHRQLRAAITNGRLRSMQKGWPWTGCRRRRA